jgi:hypothetical protein
MRSAVSIYILIPLILVPQLLLGGAMIKFDDLHKSMSRKIFVPVVGDIMVTRWAYEAISVEQFKSNRFEKPFFAYDMEIRQNDWYASFLLPTLKAKIGEVLTDEKKAELSNYTSLNLKKVNYHIKELSSITGIKPDTWVNNLSYDKFNEFTAAEAKSFLDSLTSIFRAKSRSVTSMRNSLYQQISLEMGEDQFIKLRETDYNENLANIVMNNMATNKIYDAGDRFIQKADPVFMPPGSRYGRAQFFAPYKQLGDLKISTLLFNIIVIWLMVITFFITLYYNVLKRFIAFLESLKLPILRKYGRDFLQI